MSPENDVHYQQVQRAMSGRPLDDSVTRAVNRGALPGLSWPMIWMLVQQYGPMVMDIIKVLTSGQQPAAVPAPVTAQPQAQEQPASEVAEGEESQDKDEK